MPLAPGDVFAGYTVIRQIGSGGMGEVYLVRHPRLPRNDALKLLNRELSSEPDFVARFMREADIVSGLSHHNIVSIYDRGDEGGQLWLTMRYVDGIDAEAALEQAGGLLPAARAVHIISEVAGALDAAHRRHLIHRDVKPANILMCASDEDEPEQVFLTDFGIAKSLDAGARLTRTGLVVATFDYASPEQIEAQPLDARSDVYSLGCVLYKLLTGHVPFPGETMLAPAAGHLSLPAPRPTAIVPWLAPGLDDVVARAMAKDPAQRFPTCRALAAAAAAAMNDYPAVPGPPYRVFLTRAGNGSGSALVGPMRTDGMTEPEAARLVALVRRTRFFDLPEQLAGSGGPPPGHRKVTIEIGCTGRAHRVVADLDTPRRPPELEDLIATIERMPTVLPPPRPTAPPTQRSAPPPPHQQAATRQDTPAGARPGAPPARSRFAQPPPPLPPPAVPRPVTHEQRAGTSPPPVAEPRSGPPPDRRPTRSGPPTPPPVRTPPVRFPDPPWDPPAVPALPRRGRRTALIAVATAVVVGAGLTTWLLIDGNTDDGGGSDAGQTTTEPAPTTPPTEDARAAWAELPRTTTLGPDTLVGPREVDGNTDLYVIEADGTLGARLTTAAEDDVAPLISKDRRNIVYVRRTEAGNELRTVSVDGLGDRALFATPLQGCGAPSRPAWNPADPTQLALACNDGPTTTLRVISLDGVTLHDLEPARPHIDDLTFSPDGRQLAYWGDSDSDARAGHLYVQPADGSAEADRVTTAGTDNGPVWAPAGRTLAFSRGNDDGTRQILTIDLDDSDAEPTAVLAPVGDSMDTAPAWSPDGEMIAFRSDRSGSRQYWVVDADGGNPRQLTTEGRADGVPAWGDR